MGGKEEKGKTADRRNRRHGEKKVRQTSVAKAASGRCKAEERGEEERMKERKSALTPVGLHRPAVKHSLNSTADFTAFASTVRHAPLALPCSCASRSTCFILHE